MGAHIQLLRLLKGNFIIKDIQDGNKMEFQDISRHNLLLSGPDNQFYTYNFKYNGAYWDIKLRNGVKPIECKETYTTDNGSCIIKNIYTGNIVTYKKISNNSILLMPGPDSEYIEYIFIHDGSSLEIIPRGL